MDGWLSVLLRCIVVKATQVLESSLVAELVLVLCGKTQVQMREKCISHKQRVIYLEEMQFQTKPVALQQAASNKVLTDTLKLALS